MRNYQKLQVHKMKIDTAALNLITHAAGRAVIEISLMDALLTKTAMVDKLHELSAQTDVEEEKYLFDSAANIVRRGSLSDIEFTEKKDK